ncbi:MAG TPA: hypothetical protein VM865_03130 [Acidobacteriaceae bacterium]|nr:hypothetical protein [Acidobacteriaceae bacterium]
MHLRFLASALVFALTLAAASPASAQADPSAARALEISAFGGLTGTYTGLSGGKNLGLTAGLDLGLRSYYSFRPFLEGRGTFPIDGGHIDSQKSALGGLRVDHAFFLPGLRAYGDILIGRGEIKYENGGYPSLDRNFLYTRSVGNVLSPGVGLEYRLTSGFSALADVQFQHWTTPVTPSGSLWAKPMTVGVRYRFNFNRRGYPTR